MGIGGSFSGISFTGIASGIDSDSIVRQLMQLEALPIQRMQRQQVQLQTRQTLYAQLRSQMQALASSASSLNAPDAFNAIKASSSASDVATVTATSSASPGTFTLQVSHLARNHKIVSQAQSSATDAFGSEGTFVLNGKIIEVGESDSLNQIAQKINDAKSGVTASVINGGPGNAYLSLTSSATGAKSQIQLSALSGTVLDDLDLLSGAAGLRELDGNVAKSLGFSSKSTNLAELMGGSLSGTISVNGTLIAIDTEADSLEGIAAKINTSGSGATASVIEEKIGGKTVQRLAIDGNGAPPTLTDTSGILGALGFLQSGFGNEVIEARDAAFTIDGIALTSDSNTVTDVVQGVTLSLKSADPDNPKSTVIELVRDTDGIKQKFDSLLKSYNNIVDFVKTNSKFDTETFSSGPLFGDFVARSLEDSLANIIFQNVGSGPFSNPASIGFGFDSDGRLTLNEEMLGNALAQNPEAVRRLVSTFGESTAEGLNFVSSTTATRSAPSTGYEVSITQLATKSATVAQESLDITAGGEILTFSGKVFNDQSIDLIIPAGLNASQVADLINGFAAVNENVFASVEDGKLKIESKRWGSVGDFTVVSNTEARTDNTGIGDMGVLHTVGLDIAGTIGGESATGSGQFLTGDSGNPNTAGLQVSYTGTELGLVGNILFSKGMASLLADRVNQYNDSVDGVLTINDRSLQQQIDDIDARIAAFQEQLARREEILRRRYAAMESAIANFQSQISRLGAITAQQGQ